MIIDWIKRRRVAAKQAKEMKRAAAFQEREKDTDEWGKEYFRDISFPIVIFSKKDYLAVSSLSEYYYDVDINIWFVNSDCELVDSKGQKI